MRNRSINGTDIPCHWHMITTDAKPCRQMALINEPKHKLSRFKLCAFHLRRLSQLAPRPITERVVTKTKVRRRTVHTSIENDLRIDIAERDETIQDLQIERNHLRAQLDEATQPKRRPIDITQPGKIYILRSGGFYKIGWTADIAKRMKGYPPDTQLLALHDGTRADEKRLHQRFAHLKTHGREWFAMGPDITAHIDAMIAKHGIPDAVQFMAKPVQIPMPHRINDWTGPTPKGYGRRR